MDPLLVADSFRVRANPENGASEVRGFAYHLERFSRSVRAATGGAPTGVDGFLADARRRIAEYGAGNPRLELHPDLTTHLRLRPLPELRQTIELRSAGRVALDHPERKGPSIGRFAALNRELGAEALLLDEPGNAVEGATTALLWWSGPILCAVETGARVSSVTEMLVLDAAAAADVRTERRSASPAELARGEVWAVNALHGIRPVTAIDGVAARLPDAERLTRFREALDRAWEPVAR